MSLFTSAFASSTAGPSYSSVTSVSNGAKGNKRKRPSSGNGNGNDEELRRQAQANLEKLMKKVDTGKAISKKDGNEPMGVMSKKPKKNGRDSLGGLEGNGTPSGKSKSKSGTTPQKSSSSTPNGKKSNKPVAEDAAPPTSSSKVNKYPAGSTPSSSKLAPAELPLPHSFHANDLSESNESEEGLTKLQKGMKAKLEGARFR
jgi:ribosomal RNA-processing protein 8